VGIPADRILLEEQSQTTEGKRSLYRTAVETNAEIKVASCGVLVPNAQGNGAFRKAGFNVLAFPAGPRTHGWQDIWRPSDTATDNLRRVDLAIHEWLGLVDYRLRGFTDAWFPGLDAPPQSPNARPASFEAGVMPDVMSGLRLAWVGRAERLECNEPQTFGSAHP